MFTPKGFSLPANCEYVLNRRERRTYYIFVLIWVISNIQFWTWWFKPEHTGSLAMFIFLSLALSYESTILPSFYLFFLGKMQHPYSNKPNPGLRVAMITLCVPQKESFEIIKKQLEAMVKVSYPHNSWVLDEGADTRIKALAEELGVNYFTRKGIDKYNKPHPPFQTKTKAGNVNAWLDQHGGRYDFFTQLDIDHIPKPNYLDRVLCFFEWPKIAWVQAPSVYKNLNFWTARGSAEQELVLQGPLQMGFYGFSRTPFIIGSHTTYRIRAVIEIGGFQPTRAEDHLDTIVLASKGYQGIFIPEIIAEGDGPESFDTYLKQQFAWAYSMIQVLLHHTGKYFKKYSLKQKVQFLFTQTWYPLWALSMAALFSLPLLALLFNTPIAYMPFGECIIRYSTVTLTAFSIFLWSWKKHWLKPNKLFISWRGIILYLARWPIVLWALLNVIMKIKKPYMITPKGTIRGKFRPFNILAFFPFFLLIGLSILISLFFIFNVKDSNAQGYLIFTLEGTFLMVTVYTTALIVDIKDLLKEGVSFIQTIKIRTKPLMVLLGILFSLTATSLFAMLPIVEAITWNPPISNSQSPIVLLPSNFNIIEPETIIPLSPTKTDTPNKPTTVPTPTIFTPIKEVKSPVATSETKTVFGAYDPNKLLFEESSLVIEHVFAPWFLTEKFSAEVEQIRKNNRYPMVSIEPWPLLQNGLNGETLLEDINQGRYDYWIKKLANAVKEQKPQTILLRFGHEMELTGLYPWNQGNPQLYIEAYRRVWTIFQKEKVTNAFWVWSPAGNGGAEDYYPGKQYVDFVGITILADQHWDQLAGFNNIRSFETLFLEKERLSKLGHPLIIAEMGVSISNQQNKDRWLREAQKCIRLHPFIYAVVYFNNTNTHSSQDGYFPDWKIDKNSWRNLIEN